MMKTIEVYFKPVGLMLYDVVPVTLAYNRHGNLFLSKEKHMRFLQGSGHPYLRELMDFVVQHRVVFHPKTHEILSHSKCKRFRLKSVPKYDRSNYSVALDSVVRSLVLPK